MSKATRQSYGETLAEIGYDERIVVMDADLSKSTNTNAFKMQYPERFINAGIAEANMVSVAAGLAACGKIAFVSTFAMFAAGRAFEQIRNSVCYPRLNVKICATHAGITVGEDGATHQCIEDISLMRSIPNMKVFSPCDDLSTKSVIREIAKLDGPAYLRLGRLAVPQVYNKENFTFELGKGTMIKDGADGTIIATGLMVQESMKAWEILKDKGIHVRLIDIHSIKPIDREIIIKAAKETGSIITVEEHSVIGGLGSAVCEVLSEHYPCRVSRMGINDLFGKSGKPDELIERYGIDAASIVKRVIEMSNNCSE